MAYMLTQDQQGILESLIREARESKEDSCERTSYLVTLNRALARWIEAEVTHTAYSPGEGAAICDHLGSMPGYFVVATVLPRIADVACTRKERFCLVCELQREIAEILEEEIGENVLA